MSRIREIDILRGIAIILIMVGHFYQGYVFVDYIYIFHVPLFFIISGICMNAQIGWKDFVLNKLRTIVVPYFAFGLIIVPAKFIYETDHSLLNFIKITAKYIIQQRYTTMWFLAALLVSQLVFYFLLKLAARIYRKSSDTIASIGVILLTAVICFYEKTVNISLPWNFDVGLLCVIFIASGYFFRKYIFEYEARIPGSLKTIVSFVCILVGGTLGVLSLIISGQRVDICYGNLGIPLFSIPAAILISFGLLVLLQVIPNIKGLEYIGQHTMAIFALHQMLFNQIFLKTLGFSSSFLIFCSMCLSLFFCLFIDAVLCKSRLKWIVGKK